MVHRSPKWVALLLLLSCCAVLVFNAHAATVTPAGPRVIATGY